MKSMTPHEISSLKRYLETGDPIKDRYDEEDLIRRLVTTLGNIQVDKRRLQRQMTMVESSKRKKDEPR